MTEPRVDKSFEGTLRSLDRDVTELQRRLARASSSRWGTSAARDSAYGVPTTVSEQVAVANREPWWYNTDYGWAESYYAPSGSPGLTARGLVVDANIPAGWYPISDGPRGRLHSNASQQAHSNGSYYTNWMNFGSSLPQRKGESWRSHAAFIVRPAGDNATISALMAGRYDMELQMQYQNGSGTGVWEFGLIDGFASSVTQVTQIPVVLLGSYGQIHRLRYTDTLIASTGRCYGATASASWAVGGDRSYMTMKYLGPPLVNDTAGA